MQSYKQIVNDILEHGELKKNRTGVTTIAFAGSMFTHDMSNGFPLLTTKFVSLKTVATELEFFIKGITDKKWLQDRDCHIWDSWCNPQKIPYGNDEFTKFKMKNERDLGRIYSFHWRHFGGDHEVCNGNVKCSGGVDQLKNLTNTLKTNPNDRRMIVNSWNPLDLDEMALPPCHYSYQVTVINNKLNLLWNQRSVDVALGLPYNIASYGLLLLLLCKESGFEPGKLIGFLGDTHIYTNHIDNLKDQISREEYNLPDVNITNFNSIFNWEYEQFELLNYKHHPKVLFNVAV